MKKFYICSLLFLGMLFQPVFAKTIPVQALSNFSTEKPPRSMRVKILESITLDEGLLLEDGYVVQGRIVDVKDPKRLKRNATFSFVPTSFMNNQGKIIYIKGYYPAKYTTKINKGQLAKTTALGVGNFFVKGLSMGYSAVEGAIKNEKDNRFKSSVNAVYEDSPFSYVKKGGEIVIQNQQVFFLNFKVKDEPDEEDKPNYEYTELGK